MSASAYEDWWYTYKPFANGFDLIVLEAERRMAVEDMWYWFKVVNNGGLFRNGINFGTDWFEPET